MKKDREWGVFSAPLFSVTIQCHYLKMFTKLSQNNQKIGKIYNTIIVLTIASNWKKFWEIVRE
ncbi:hypothetical protein HW35_09130 [Bacillus sp. X1(2014)]|nr:hypothetical protein HW35_09130 [Bacillus sp. X1(2014)]